MRAGIENGFGSITNMFRALDFKMNMHLLNMPIEDWYCTARGFSSTIHLFLQ